MPQVVQVFRAKVDPANVTRLLQVRPAPADVWDQLQRARPGLFTDTTGQPEAAHG